VKTLIQILVIAKNQEISNNSNKIQVSSRNSKIFNFLSWDQNQAGFNNQFLTKKDHFTSKLEDN